MEPTSLLFRNMFRVFEPYLEATWMNHGYHFFAPEPGPSHLIRYRLMFADGTSREGIFPDPNEHSPRLLYHRHFMISETAGRLADQDRAQQARNITAPDSSRTPAAESLDLLSRSIASHLKHAHGANSVQLLLRRHYIPTPEQVAAGVKLDSVELLAERPLGDFTGKAATRLADTSTGDVHQ